MAHIHLNLKITSFLFAVSSLLIAADQPKSISFEQPAGHSAFEKFSRSLSCYVSDALVGSHEPLCRQSSRWQFNVAELPELGQEQLGATFTAGSGTIDVQKISNWWGTWSYALREKPLQNQIIASDLETFTKNTSFKTWATEVVAPSMIKRKTRVIYRSPEHFARGISVAQTLDTEAPDLSAKVIETEVAIDRNDESGNSDFYSYDAAGRLATTSKFPSGEKPVPSFCLGCHFSPSSGTFTRLN